MSGWFWSATPAEEPKKPKDRKFGSFKENHTLDKRKELSARIINNYPDRVPVIVESNDIKLDKHKYLAPNDMTFAKFQMELRTHAPDVGAHEAMFCFVDKKMAVSAHMLNQTYSQHKDDDGFLYVVLSTKDKLNRSAFHDHCTINETAV